MAKKIKYNSSASRWELLDNTTILAFMAGSATDDPWTINGGIWPYADGSGKNYTLTAGGTVDGNVVSSDILAGKVAYARGKRITGTIEVNPEISVTDNQVTISKGYHDAKVVTVDVINTGDESVYGYLNEDGKFQALDLTGDTPQDSGSPETINGNVYLYVTGQDEPDYDIAEVIPATITVDKNVVTITAGTVATEQKVAVGESLGAKTYTPGTTDQTIPVGKYTTGAQTIKGDINLVAGNIKEGVTIFGIDGTHKDNPAIDLSGVTATSADVLMTAMFIDANGELQEGSIQTVTAQLTDNVFEVQEGFISTTTMKVEEAADPTVNGNQVTIHKGYNAEEQTITVESGVDIDPAELNLIDTSAVLEDYTFAGRNEDGSIEIFNGSLENKGELTVTPNSDIQTFDGGYYMAISVNPAPKTGSEITVNGVIDDPLYYMSERVSVDGEAGILRDKRFESGDSIGTITNLDPLWVASTGAMIIGENNYVEVDSTNITAENIKDGITILGVTGEYKGAEGATIEYGVITEDGKFQELDLTGTPTSKDPAEDIESLDMFETGEVEPSYTASSNANVYYKCTEVPSGNSGLGFTLSGSPIDVFNGMYIRTEDRITDDVQLYKWVNTTSGAELKCNEEYSMSNGWAIFGLYKAGSSNSSYELDYPITSPGDLTDFSKYNGNWVISGTTDPVDIVCSTSSEMSGESVWSGYVIRFDGHTWYTTSTVVKGLEIKGLTPAVGGIYSEDTTVKVEELFKDISSIKLTFPDEEYSKYTGVYTVDEESEDFKMVGSNGVITGMVMPDGGTRYTLDSTLTAESDRPELGVTNIGDLKWNDNEGNNVDSTYEELRKSDNEIIPPTEEESSSSSTPSVPEGAVNVVIIAEILDYSTPHTLTMYPSSSAGPGVERAWAGESDYGLFDISGNPDGTWVFQSSAGFTLWTEGPYADPWNSSWTGGDTGRITVIGMTAVPIEQ